MRAFVLFPFKTRICVYMSKTDLCACAYVCMYVRMCVCYAFKNVEKIQFLILQQIKYLFFFFPSLMTVNQQVDGKLIC